MIHREVARCHYRADPFAMDVWSLGVCLYTLMTGVHLYLGPHEEVFQILEEGGAWSVVARLEAQGGIRPLPKIAKVGDIDGP